MPNFSGTPATVTWAGGSATFSPPRFSGTPAATRWTGGSASWTIGDDPSATSSVIELDRLTSFEKILNPDGTPSPRFMGFLQEFAEKIEEAFANQGQDISDLASIVARLTAAEAVAAAANDNANAVSSAADIADSYTSPVDVLTASNDGSITIAAHSRVYPVSDTTVSVNSGSVTGFLSGDSVTVYYADAGKSGGAVTYEGTTSAVAQSGTTHVVGVVTIPAAGEPSTSGTGVTAPGVPSGTGGGKDYITP